MAIDDAYKLVFQRLHFIEVEMLRPACTDSYSAITIILSTALSFVSSLTFKMDTGKIAQEALTYAKGLTDGNAAKSPLIATAEKWIADHSKNPMSMTALGDANKIKVSNRYYDSICLLPERA